MVYEANKQKQVTTMIGFLQFHHESLFCFPKLNCGFSLIEMAVVLVILGFVLSALMLPLQAQRTQLQQTETEKHTENLKALIGYGTNLWTFTMPGN